MFKVGIGLGQTKYEDRLEELIVLTKGTKYEVERSNIVSVFEYGSTYQGTNDSASDVDLCVLYLSRLEDLLFNKENEVSKNLPEISIKLIPLHKFYGELRRTTFFSVLLLNAQLEYGSSYLNSTLLKDFYNTQEYTEYIKSHFYTIISSINGNLNRIQKKTENDGIDGKRLVQTLTFIDLFYKLEREELDYKTLNKVSQKLQEDVVKLKRYTSLELKTLDYSQYKYFDNKGIEDYEDLTEFLELESNRISKEGKNLKLNNDFNGNNYNGRLLKGLKEGITNIYKQEL